MEENNEDLTPPYIAVVTSWDDEVGILEDEAVENLSTNLSVMDASEDLLDSVAVSSWLDAEAASFLPKKSLLGALLLLALSDPHPSELSRLWLLPKNLNLLLSAAKGLLLLGSLYSRRLVVLTGSSEALLLADSSTLKGVLDEAKLVCTVRCTELFKVPTDHS